MILGFKEARPDGSTGLVAKPARLAGIQCPCPGQAFSAESKTFTDNALHTRFKDAEVKVLVNTSPRWVVDFVLPDGNSLARELLRNGLAWTQPFNMSLPDEREYGTSFKSLEEEARKERRGLWTDPNPVAPWRFVAELPAGSGGPGKGGLSDEEIKTGKILTSGLRPALSAQKPAEGSTTDVTTKVMALMRKKSAMLDQLVQERNNAGVPGNFESKVKQLNRWAESELDRIIKEGSPEEAKTITRNLSPTPPPNVSAQETTGITSLNEDPFVKSRVDDLMKREGERIAEIVAKRNSGGSQQEFEVQLSQLDQWEDSVVAAIVKEAFLHKQALVMQELDRIPRRQLQDYPSWDFVPLRRDVFDHGRWIGRIVQDRNGNIVWYDRPDGPAHWIKYLWLKN
jgi:hypothetical protein